VPKLDYVSTSHIALSPPFQYSDGVFDIVCIQVKEVDVFVDKVRKKIHVASESQRHRAIAASEEAKHAQDDAAEARHELEEAKRQLKQLLSERSSAWESESARLKKVAELADRRVVELEKEAECLRKERARYHFDEGMTRAVEGVADLESELEAHRSQVLLEG
jgi:chromosome segregation ATPase